ncbi:MAG: hypothetical protein ACOYXU_09875 [Nitrospirota bacterium]
MPLLRLKAAALYFVLVFGAGFVLGPIRVLWVVPRFGERTAELMEMPIMFVVIVLAAQWTCRRLSVPPVPTRRLMMGVVALMFLLVPEFTVVLWFQGLTLSQYVSNRDPVAGTVYILMLVVYAVMPLLVARR